MKPLTRGDLAAALYRSETAADFKLSTEACNRLADVVLPLLAEAPQPEVLAEAVLVQAVRANTSNTGLLPVKGKSCLPWYLRLDAPPGTRVLVVEAPASPAPEEPTP